MHILVLAQYFPPDVGGASTRASNVVRGLLARGHRLTVVAGFPHYPEGRIPKEYRWKTISLESFEGSRLMRVWLPPLPHEGFAKRMILFFSFMLSSLFPLLAVGKIAVVWAANPNFFSFFPALVYSMVKRCPVTRNVDDLWPEVLFEMGWIRSKLLRGLLHGLSWLTYRLSKAITPVSPGYVDVLVEDYAIPPGKIQLVEVGVDVDAFTYHEPRRGGERFLVTYSGVLGPGYDLDLILETAQQLSRTPIQFLIHGSGELEGYIRAKVQTLGLSKVRVDSRSLPPRSYIDMLAKTDAFMLALAEAADPGLPTKVFEYMAIGRPIICRSRGPTGSYVKEAGAGIVFEIRSPSLFAESLTRLASDVATSSVMGRRGREFVQLNHSIETVGAKIERALLACLV